MLNERQQLILRLIIEHFIMNAEPIGSRFLVEECGLEVSGATVRNEMRDMEEQGFLTHSHTSSGRMPTTAGYRYYIDQIMKPMHIGKEDSDQIAELLRSGEGTRAVKNIAKYIAEKTNNAVIVAFGSDALYYTGMSHLFAQPEFRDYAYLVKASTIFDQCEERIDDVIEMFTHEPRVLIGDENPFGQMTSMVGIKMGDVLFTMLGPMRMDYARAHGYATFISSLILE